MFSIFSKPRVVDDQTASNIFAVFHWALSNFDAVAFVNSTILVKPTRESFPDRADNELDMVKNAYSRVLRYSGLSGWPFVLAPQQQVASVSPPLLQIDTAQRMNNTISVGHTGEALLVSYSSAMLKKPMDLVASMSKAVAQHYLYQSGAVPPAGLESFNETSEILSIFMGFGVLVANSAYTFRGSCARCYDPNANRVASLAENEAVFSLAVFCALKNIPTKDVTPHLKSYLRPMYKKASKQVLSDEKNLLMCQDLLVAPSANGGVFISSP